jgi:hypothetical protein
MTKHAKLALLFAGYFHQDWDLQTPSWPEVVDRFSASESPQNVKDTAAELRHLLTTERDDRKLEDTVRSLGCAYLPEDSISLRSWLWKVVERLDQLAESVAGS